MGIRRTKLTVSEARLSRKTTGRKRGCNSENCTNIADTAVFVAAGMSHCGPYPVPPMETEASMKRPFVMVLGALAVAAVFARLVYVVLVASHVSEPAATAVDGLTPRRAWATTAFVLALVDLRRRRLFDCEDRKQRTVI